MLRIKVDEIVVNDYRVKEIIERELLKEGFMIDEELNNNGFNDCATTMKIYSDKI